MPLGDRLRELRQRRGWSQAQLARKLDVHQKQISGYERGVHTPSVEALVKIAKAFNVSLDYLALDEHVEQRTTIADRELVERLEAIDKLSEADKATVKAVLDTFIVKSRFQRLAAGTGG
jgi:transcriptional regulator with XRE-family HTH domain